MSSAAWVFAGMVWISFVGVLLTVIWLKKPAPKKPLERDALEAVDAALKSRIVDLEDKFESYVKREAVRGMRARKDAAADDAAQGILPLDRATRLSALRAKIAQRNKVAGSIFNQGA